VCVSFGVMGRCSADVGIGTGLLVVHTIERHGRPVVVWVWCSSVLLVRVLRTGSGLLPCCGMLWYVAIDGGDGEWEEHFGSVRG